MWSEIILIVLAMFAVLGVWYFSETCAAMLCRRSRLKDAVVVLAAQTPEAMWERLLCVRSRLPDSEIIVLCTCAEQYERLAPSLRRVAFAAPQDVAQVICRTLGTQQH